MIKDKTGRQKKRRDYRPSLCLVVQYTARTWQRSAAFSNLTLSPFSAMAPVIGPGGSCASCCPLFWFLPAAVPGSRKKLKPRWNRAWPETRKQPGSDARGNDNERLWAPSASTVACYAAAVHRSMHVGGTSQLLHLQTDMVTRGRGGWDRQNQAETTWKAGSRGPICVV